MPNVIKVKEEYPDVANHDAEKFRDYLIEMEERVNNDLTIDLNGVDQLNSLVVSAIIYCYNNMSKNGKKLSVINAGHKNVKIFEMLNVHDVMR